MAKRRGERRSSGKEKAREREFESTVPAFTEFVEKSRKRRRASWRRKHARGAYLANNPVADFLAQVYEATGEQVIGDALLILRSYDLHGPHATRRLQTVRRLLSDVDHNLPQLVELDLEDQRAQVGRQSLRRAFRNVALGHISEASTVEAAAKRVERAYRSAQNGSTPTGDIGKMWVGAPQFDSATCLTTIVERKLVPNDRSWRKAIAMGRLVRLPY